MSVKVKINMNETRRILLKRCLNKNGKAQIDFTKECAKEMNNFGPFDTGRLKDMSIELGNDFVKYNTPYASKQYYTNTGNGKQGLSHGGRRGKRWNIRMWIGQGGNIIKRICIKYGVRGDKSDNR